MADLKTADVIILTFSCDKPHTIENLKKRWLPLLRGLRVEVPLLVVGCKLDLRPPSPPAPSLESYLSPIMSEYRQIEACLECSALLQVNLQEVFSMAQKAVAHPLGPLFDASCQKLRPKCVRALSRIFRICDRDGDGLLSDSELNAFQVRLRRKQQRPSF